MVAVGIFKADVGKTILYALIIGIPTAVISGPIYGKWIGARIHKNVPKDVAERLNERDTKKELPGFGNTLFTILLPVLLMLGASIAEVALEKNKSIGKDIAFYWRSCRCVINSNDVFLL